MDEERSRKRRKVDSGAPETSASPSSADELQRLLQFSQSPSPRVVAAINQFKTFVSSIAENQNTAIKEHQFKILKEYCDQQSSETHEQVDFPDLLSVWSSASQSNDEAILWAVPAALSQFFRTISSRLEFREFGLSLCHSLLKRDHLRIFDKCLSLPRSKERITIACLQLLTEIISFDGGALAGNVFGRRDYLYRRLDGFFAQTPAEGAESTASTVHRAALEFLLANLKYLDTESKTELITHGKTLYSAVRTLPRERADVVIQTLKVLEKSVLDDESLSKQVRGRCFNSGFLSALAKLYDYSGTSADTAEVDGGSSSVRDALQHLLIQVCTTTKGPLLRQTGWYPPGSNPDVLPQDGDMVDLGFDSPYYFDEYTQKVSVKNGTLSIFIQGLKPKSDSLQANLIISIFKAAPELVADYFTKKPKFVVPPGDDPLWRGQFAFLFSVVQLPVPPHCGWPEGLPLTPPPLSVAIESILPRPLDRSTLTKCLQTKDDIIIISAARVLTVAMDKLASVLDIFDDAHPSTTQWSQASTRLLNLFIDRVPPMQDLVTALQSLDQDNEQVRTSILECLATYHKVLPETTAASKFDIGPTLGKTLRRLESDTLEEDTRSILDEQLQHLVQIANVSLATKWFSKTASDAVSLIVQLLKYSVQHPANIVAKQSLSVIRTILSDKGILNPDTGSFQALVASLTPTKKWQAELETYQFLDNCMTRTMQRPVKYLDRLEQMQQMLSDSKGLSLIACCMAEQWPFVVKKGDKKATKNIAEWTARFFSALDAAGENWRVLSHLQEEMKVEADGDEKAKAALVKALEKQRKKPVELPSQEPSDNQKGTARSESIDGDGASDIGTGKPSDQTGHAVDLDTVFDPQPSIPSSLQGLDRWTKPDFESEIKSGRLANLLRCLISPDAEIRLQAFHTLHTVMHEVEQSTFAEKTQLYLLLGEVYETVRVYSSSSNTNSNNKNRKTTNSSTTSPLSTAPPPSIIAELAIQILPVIADPSSPFYRKTNKFLLRSPSWTIPSLLPYWLSTTFLAEPESDDTDHVGGVNAQSLEIDRLLDLLANSLRTQTDMDLYRRAHVFTRLFSYFFAPVCRASARKKILGIVHIAASGLASGGENTTTSSSGTDTLITRVAVREWLSIARALLRNRNNSGHNGSTRSGASASTTDTDTELSSLLDSIAREIQQTCDADAIFAWESQRPIFKIADANAAAEDKDKDE
ncbi:hypothetical protein HRR90_005405 [Exophiala dermatitidis]|uniref:Uncharacterized protein n=1 Tax=Exophiala dermatitidis TaxID=5970 RepID=A0AAN6IRF5_EXODE|nr:hypothetical protein HRR73_008889 [Exophiala dermatitidis]KAJ4507734.1 hypothetical protein HRR75_006444 [Exophiala dermatitidis]KAJ4509869.1 hypothetical protein HRR74_007021 [Exophiala dermatitidis]KAJ4539579.1 hypothetical protein HRR77_006458 [Exophiala dermatitidis]KAJ4542649.1 hypothetical protein HRR78_006738 [Exophiala dermatitidis]